MTLVTKSSLTLVTLQTVAHQAPLSIGFPSKNTGVGCHFLLQGSDSDRTQVSCIGRWILYHWSTREAQTARICSLFNPNSNSMKNMKNLKQRWWPPGPRSHSEPAVILTPEAVLGTPILINIYSVSNPRSNSYRTPPQAAPIWHRPVAT